MPDYMKLPVIFSRINLVKKILCTGRKNLKFSLYTSIFIAIILG